MINLIGGLLILPLAYMSIAAAVRWFASRPAIRTRLDAYVEHATAEIADAARDRIEHDEHN
jgi:hypothetical protein